MRLTKTEAKLTSAIRALYAAGAKEQEVNGAIIKAHNTVKAFFDVPKKPDTIQHLKENIRVLRQQNKTDLSISNILETAKQEVILEDFYNTRTF